MPCCLCFVHVVSIRLTSENCHFSGEQSAEKTMEKFHLRGEKKFKVKKCFPSYIALYSSRG